MAWIIMADGIGSDIRYLYYSSSWSHQYFIYVHSNTHVTYVYMYQSSKNVNFYTYSVAAIHILKSIVLSTTRVRFMQIAQIVNLQWILVSSPQ